MPRRLTIGIPHLDRTDTLRRTIKSCMAQTIPVHVIVADQGQTAETREMLRGSHSVEHVISGAKSLWQNWEAAARACDTEFFAWCQDDDILAPTYAERVIAAFDRFPNALHWQARLQCAAHNHLGCWYLGNGPWLPMDMQGGQIGQWNGTVLVHIAYVTSGSLSPAQAFRCGQHFNDALEAMPEDCGVFYERLIPAFLGRFGLWVADPVVAGYWMQHGSNESRKQWKDQPRQTAVMLDHLDRWMDGLNWEESFKQWAAIMPTGQIVSWINQLAVTRKEGKPSKYLNEIEHLMILSLAGRVEFGGQRKWFHKILNWALSRAAL